MTLLLSESAEAPCVLFFENSRGVLAPREEQLTESTYVQKRGADAVRAELLVQYMCVAQPTTRKRSTHTPDRPYRPYRTLCANISAIWPAVPLRGCHLSAWRHCTSQLSVRSRIRVLRTQNALFCNCEYVSKACSGAAARPLD